MNLKDLKDFQAAVNTDADVSIKEVVENPYATNANKLIANLAEVTGVKKVFKRRVIETEQGEIYRDYPTKEACQAITEALRA